MVTKLNVNDEITRFDGNVCLVIDELHGIDKDYVEGGHNECRH